LRAIKKGLLRHRVRSGRIESIVVVFEGGGSKDSGC